MFQTKFALCLSVLTVALIPSSHALAQGRKTATEPQVVAPVDASIGAITSLARQVKVAELQKQLREARQAATPPIAIQSNNQAPVVIPVLNQNAAPVAAPVAPKPQPPQQPSIQSISSIGGKYSAIATDGSQLEQGSRLQLGEAMWTVSKIASTGVTFEKCVKGKCAPVLIAVSI